jgi:flagellin-like hook-associated protein FlgL
MAIGRAVDLRTSSAHLDALKRLQDTADSRMSEAEQAMADAAQVLDEFHQLWVQTQNGALGGAQLQAFTLQAKSLQEELQQILTRADSRGYRLFDATELDVVIGGASNGVGPVKINTVGGVGGLRVLNPSLDEGWEKDQTLDEAVDLNGERIELEDLNFLEASRAMIHERIYLGANQARLERARVRVENVQVATKTSLAEEVDTDYAKSTMEVQKAKALMEAAQTISAQIGTMNLFQKLG